MHLGANPPRERPESALTLRGAGRLFRRRCGRTGPCTGRSGRCCMRRRGRAASGWLWTIPTTATRSGPACPIPSSASPPISPPHRTAPTPQSSLKPTQPYGRTFINLRLSTQLNIWLQVSIRRIRCRDTAPAVTRRYEVPPHKRLTVSIRDAAPLPPAGLTMEVCRGVTAICRCHRCGDLSLPRAVSEQFRRIPREGLSLLLTSYSEP